MTSHSNKIDLKSCTVHEPATVANLVCGFDVLGMCLEQPYDIMEMKLLDEKKVIIISRDNYRLPSDPAQNTAGAPLFSIFEEIDLFVGFLLVITK